ncbi:MAG: recombinase family protein [Oscillospiraceae bacterium]|nr:recombinase family protein [Oscillospiraceae bacterium]MCL2279510.1 recombinase family protein [Oscillospiraceae bacterium]
MMNNYKQTAKKPRKMTALYERLSRDDDMDGLSNSILTQMQILEDFAKKNKFTNIRHFQDDGISGTTFDRKGWNELIEEIKAGNVAIVAVKEPYVKQKLKFS